MSWLNQMVDEGEIASQIQRLERTTELPEPDFFAGGLDVIGPGLKRAGLQTAGATESLFSSMWQTSLETAAGVLLPEPKFGGTPDVTSAERTSQETLGQGVGAEVTELRPDPRVVGVAGQLIGEAAAVLPPFIVGSMVGGPGLGAVAAGGSAGYAKKQTAMFEGIDESTATKLGLTEGLTAGVGAVLPAARVVKSFAGDAALVVGANVGLGMGHRAASASLLESNGYEAQAAQYRVLDGMALATDAILGAAFFGIGRATMRPTTQQVDAALTERNAQHADIDTAPGAPINPKSAAAHQEAINTALQQLSRGKSVTVPESVHSAEFLRTNHDDSPLRQTIESTRTEISTTDARIAGEDFAARVGRNAEYDDVGSPIFQDGTAFPLSEAGKFFDQYVAHSEPKGGAPMPDVLFQIGRIDDATAQGLHDFLPGFNDGLREARISGRSIKHIQDSRPGIVRDVLDRLQRGVLNADEVLPNPQNPKRALLVLRDVGDQPTKARHQSTVIELSANGKGVDVVSAMTMPDRTLNKARALKEEIEASRPEGLRSPHPPLGADVASTLTRQQTNFPTVDRDASGASISESEQAAMGTDTGARSVERPESDPVIQIADEILARMDDMRLATGALDAEGAPVTVSARELMAEADAEILRAQEESRGFSAAATCFLQQGLD